MDKLFKTTMTQEQWLAFNKFTSDMDSLHCAYYAFVDAHNDAWDIERLIEINVVRRDYLQAPKRDGINEYFPQYPYKLTLQGETILSDLSLIEFTRPTPDAESGDETTIR